jgi:hypothetical protein
MFTFLYCKPLNRILLTLFVHVFDMHFFGVTVGYLVKMTGPGDTFY